MTDNNKPPAEPTSVKLLEQLRDMKDAPILQKGEAAIRLAETTVIHLRDLERRVMFLESKQ